MVKPQFEVGKERLGSGGVVRSAELRAEAVRAVASRAAELGLAYLAWWRARFLDLPGMSSTFCGCAPGRLHSTRRMSTVQWRRGLVDHNPGS